MTSSPTPESTEIDVLDIIRILSRCWRFMVLVPLSVGLLTLGISFLIPPTFTASTTLMPPSQQSSSTLAALAGQLGALGGLAGASGVKNPVDQYVALITSRNATDKVIERFGLKDIYGLKLLEDTRWALLANLRVGAGKKDGLITIEVDDHDPKRAADLANALVDELRRINTEFAVGEASQRRVFFEGQLKGVRQSLATAEEALNTSGISEGALNAAPQAAVAGVAKLKAAVTAQEVKIASMRGFVTDDNPDLRQAQFELAALRAQLARADEGTPVTNKQASYTDKYRQFKYQETLFELIARQYEMARLDEARDGAVIQVIDPAIVPERKSKPKKAMMAVSATLLTAVLAAAGLVAREIRSSRRQAPAV